MGPLYDHQVGRWIPPELPAPHIIERRRRRARAEAVAALSAALWRAIATLAKGVARFVYYTAYGAAKMPPQGHYRITGPAPLTGRCD